MFSTLFNDYTSNKGDFLYLCSDFFLNSSAAEFLYCGVGCDLLKGKQDWELSVALILMKHTPACACFSLT